MGGGGALNRNRIGSENDRINDKLSRYFQNVKCKNDLSVGNKPKIVDNRTLGAADTRCAQKNSRQSQSLTDRMIYYEDIADKVSTGWVTR